MGTARRQYTDEFKQEGFGAFGKQRATVGPDCRRARNSSCAAAGLA
jgi:hypothetical protein